jgi:hydroxymethylbilane synthase
MADRIVIGTRGSLLALAQSSRVISALRDVHGGAVDIEQRVYVTTGDLRLDRPLPEIGGKGVFTAELDAALRSGEIDVAVHSLKDLPVDADEATGEAVLGAICMRDAANDALIAAAGMTLAGLPHGALVGTSSLRRRAQLRVLRPDLRVESIRGNVDTRIRKVREGAYDAVLLAACGLLRLRRGDEINELIPIDAVLPAPGQAAIAVQCRRDDAAVRARLRPLDHAATRAAVMAERAFLNGLGGGCSLPVAAYAVVDGTGITLVGRVCATRAEDVIEVRGRGEGAAALGRELAALALARGAHSLLVK